MFEHWLVISDMDGTLLNHHDYQVEAALPKLEQLEQSGIPVIFNTSKTFEELKDWVSLLNNKHPFIVENGSAIYIPENYFAEGILPKQESNHKSNSGYRIIITGTEIQPIHNYLKTIKPEAIDFTQCSLSQAIDITGLSEPEAKAAQTRQFSVPLKFEDIAKQEAFSERAKQDGYGILKGGRFLHILGLCDKGGSMNVLKELYERNFNKSYGLIVLGDSQNDIAMLQQADIPVVVNSPSSDSIELDHANKIYTHNEAPEGWVEGVTLALDLKEPLINS
ncbi:MAG: HAD-IIB family hydrolase [Gammaproteobacteria bacterium]|jgi:mannosyl-3-phosphoglycerate phosphatase family protein|nr:HAD-IIB family hydrolase [Gammaproteobacteria bacterium]MBT4076869.1 HAD-IIB family hydrolase [Gammaproteobacteria bacterium]MBT4193577.1 HAD-IIB family hydrolase [Gammaproteobacteria bacterium]MBT4452018.1 HAD-IIB family hydrolase [Gammaproteobacteria bacterium]MBT4862945.1 HAD-IIB family hydrolase [Gammaproteobacteria bacterium]